MIGGDTALPRAAPVLKMPIPRARSFTGNHSPTTFAAPGQLPASPKPSTPLNTLNIPAVVANACATAAPDQTTIENTNPRRVPMRSYRRPETIWLMP